MVKAGAGQDAIDQAAADWAVRLGCGDLAPRQRDALRRWLAGDPRHARALAEARAIWHAAPSLPVPPAVAPPPPLTVAPPPPSTVAPPPPRPPARPLLAVAAAAAMVVAAGWMFRLAGPVSPWALWAADHRTGRAQHDELTLDDGTMVSLGPASAIAVRYDGGSRRVELLAGMAAFAPAPVSPEEPRPFVVAAGGGTAQALGTRFTVESFDDGAEVAVSEHRVRVTAPGGGGGAVVVGPGQVVAYGPGGLGPVHGRDPAQAAAWREDRLVFDGVPLRHVAERLSRYRSGRVVVAAPAAGSLVSGVFNARDPDGALDTIARVMGLRIAQIPGLLAILY